MKKNKISIFLVTLVAAFTLCLSLPKTQVNAATQNISEILNENFTNTYFAERQENTLFYLGNNFNVEYYGFNIPEYSNRSFGVTNYTLREYNKGVRYMSRYGTDLYAFAQPSSNGSDFVIYNNYVCDYVTYEFNDLLLPSTVSNPNLPNLIYDFFNNFGFTFDGNNISSLNIGINVDFYQNNSETEGLIPNYIPSYDIYRVYNFYSVPVAEKPITLTMCQNLFNGFEPNVLYSLDTSGYTSSSISTYVPYLIYIPRISLNIAVDDYATLTKYYIKETIPSTSAIINNYNYAISAVREKTFYNTMLEVINSDIANSESDFGFYWGYDLGYQNGVYDGQNTHASPFVIITETVESFLNLEVFPDFHVYYILLIALGFGMFGLLVKYALGG